MMTRGLLFNLVKFLIFRGPSMIPLTLMLQPQEFKSLKFTIPAKQQEKKIINKSNHNIRLTHKTIHKYTWDKVYGN